MSETGESSDAEYENMRCREKRRKIIMRIELSDSDDGGDSDASEIERRRCPHSSSQRRSALKRPIISSDESSCDGEVAREQIGSIKDVTPSGSKAPDDGFATDSSTDETLEKCPICLITFRNQEIACPSICEHIFCFICLEEWAKNVKTCPIDRKEFKTIVVRDSFLTKNVVRVVDIDSSSSAVPEEHEDFTQCEICRLSNREDVMLLCDGCNQGYHMDCLDPPLTEIPEGAWYCDHCFEVEDDEVVEDLNLLYEDLREMGVPDSRLQIREFRQPRVPRTRQVERVRARVYARTNVRRTQSETGDLSTAPVATRKKRKRKARRKRRTYVVEYDVNNFDDKFAVKTTKRYIKKKKRSSRKKVKNSKATGCGSSSNVSQREAMSTLAVPSFSIFGNPNALEYFSDTEERFGGQPGEGSTSVQTAVRARSIVSSARRTKELIVNLDAPARNPTGGEIDVLSSIMDLQDRWHNIVRRNQFNAVHIGTDGTLSFQENPNQTGANEKRIDEAPMYQRGNNPNVSGGDRYDNQSNDFRGNSGYRNSGGQYRQSTGGNGFRSNSHRDEHSNRNFHEGFSYNIQISPHLAERIRNPRPDRRNKNRFGRNEGFKARQKPENTETNEPSTSGQMNLPMSSEDAANNFSPAEDKPETQNSNVPQLETLVPTAIPPLAPPPWNKNLFRLAGDYDEEDDDDSDCPNFSIYSAESLQVARSTEETEEHDAGNTSKEKEDDFEDKEEDLVQLGDDDEIPDAINSGKLETNNSPEVYEPENPTEESEDILEKNECADSSQDASLSNTEIVAEDQSNKEFKEDKPDHVNEISGTPKQGFLELYDKSDWDQWNVNTNKQNIDENEQPIEEIVDENDVNIEETEGVQTNMQTESISEEEEDRSYTPCLDEKTENDESIQDKDESHTPPKQQEKDLSGNDKGEVSTNVIDGMETELISDEDEEILNQEQNASASKKKDKEEGSSSKKTKKETFKKISKNTKERNYRGDKERTKDKSGRSRSKSNDKENRGSSKKNERKRVKRKEIERYDVRNVIGQPRTYKDRYGRDTSRPPRSRSRSRSRSRRKRTRSRSKFRSRSASSKRRRSFSISPSPVSYMKSSSCRRSLSSRRSRCRRSRSPRRTSTKRRSRSPLRIRSSSPKANGKRRPRFRRKSNSISTRSRSKSRSRVFTPRRGRSKSIGHLKNKRKKSKERKKKKKNRSPTLSVSPAKRSPRPPEHREVLHKKKRRSRTKSPIEEHWPIVSPRLSTVENNEFSWTPPLASSNAGNLTVILKNKDTVIEVKKKGDKKKKKEKRRDQSNKKEKRKQRSEIRESPMAPSKEVFASGDNILVSVSFNKEGNAAHAPPQQTTVVTLPPTREEILTKRRSPDRGAKKRKKSKEQGPRKHKKVDAKPVAIIDLDRSPFQEIVQSPKDIIVLTDSDQEGDECRNYSGRNLTTEIEPLEHANANKHDSIENGSNVDRTENVQEDTFDSSLQLGPKTPPEPSVIKFSLNTKSKQLKARNPLHEEQDDAEEEGNEKESEEIEKSSLNNKIGPNTPPESGPCSPDAYDPFDPTKSPSVSSSPPPPADMSTPNQNECSPAEDGRESRSQALGSQEKNINPVELVMALMSSKSSKSHEICGMNTEQQYGIPASEANDVHDKSDEGNISNKGITVFSNVLFTPGKQQRSSNLTTITSPVAKSSQSMGLSQQNVVSKLPLPRTNSNNRQNANSANDEGGVNEIESPYSPGSDDYDDLFEPPTEGSNMPQMSQRRMQAKSAQGKGNKAELFDNLFGNTSPIKIPSYTPTVVRKRGMKSYKKTAVKVAKLPGNGKMDEDQIKIFDDLPSSAVELQVKDKFLRKLNRQERVVEEVKLVLKPHYNKKHISKDDYKEILRRAVPKICHSRSQEINPKKIQNLIEAYVKKFRQRNKLGILNTGQVSSAVKCAAYLKKL